MYNPFSEILPISDYGRMDQEHLPQYMSQQSLFNQQSFCDFTNLESTALNCCPENNNEEYKDLGQQSTSHSHMNCLLPQITSRISPVVPPNNQDMVKMHNQINGHDDGYLENIHDHILNPYHENQFSTKQFVLDSNEPTIQQMFVVPDETYGHYRHDNSVPHYYEQYYINQWQNRNIESPLVQSQNTSTNSSCIYSEGSSNENIIPKSNGEIIEKYRTKDDIRTFKYELRNGCNLGEFKSIFWVKIDRKYNLLTMNFTEYHKECAKFENAEVYKEISDSNIILTYRNKETDMRRERELYQKRLSKRKPKENKRKYEKNKVPKVQVALKSTKTKSSFSTRTFLHYNKHNYQKDNSTM